MFGKTDKLGDFWGTEKLTRVQKDIILEVVKSQDKEKYLMLFQKKAYASSTYTDKKTLEFTVELVVNTYTNYSMSMITLVVPIYFQISLDKKADVDVVTVNNYFARWLKEIDRRKNFTNKQHSWSL